MNAVVLDSVAKRFKLRQERRPALQDVVLNVLRRPRSSPMPRSEEFWALNDVSLTVRQGETLGLIGPNGSGKSTILKLIARTLTPTRGTVSVNGRIAALLELGAGFHPDLSGRENVFLNGSFLGLSGGFLKQRFDEIVEFAGLEQFIDVPVKHYSSGMYVRLGFAVAIHLDADVLLIDEVLAVGDEVFQHKCMDRMLELQRSGRTLVFVSHSLGTVSSLCTTAAWLEEGTLRAVGAAPQVVNDYLADANSRALAAEGVPLAEVTNESEEEPWRWGSREIELVDVEFLNHDYKRATTFATGDQVRVRLHYVAHECINRPVFGIAIHTATGAQLCGPNTRFDEFPIEAISRPGHIDFVLDQIPLHQGTYLLSAAVYDYSCSHAFDHHDRRYSFKIVASDATAGYGLLNLPHHWEWA